MIWWQVGMLLGGFALCPSLFYVLCRSVELHRDKHYKNGFEAGKLAGRAWGDEFYGWAAVREGYGKKADNHLGWVWKTRSEMTR